MASTQVKTLSKIKGGSTSAKANKVTKIIGGFNSRQFESRKMDHISLALDSESQSSVSDWSQIRLIHEALPEMNLTDVNLKTQAFGLTFDSPIFVSSMTAGHKQAAKINHHLAEACYEKNWLLAVGSQRREMEEQKKSSEWSAILKKFPELNLAGNIGLSQIIKASVSEVQSLVDSLNARVLFVHTNPLQEALQTEGTPQFKGGLEALAKLTAGLKVPVIVKEVGSGFSSATILKLSQAGVAGVDVAGRGGTHWGRIELMRNELRNKKSSKKSSKSNPNRKWESFADWGFSTVESLMEARKANTKLTILSSGGIRNGVQVAQSLALGATLCGVAGGFLEAALKSPEVTLDLMNEYEHELTLSLFCTGSQDVKSVVGKYRVL